MTALRHEARALKDVFWREMPRDVLTHEVRRITDKYNQLIQALEVTDNRAFRAARERIKAGLFEPDHAEASEKHQEITKGE